jgi:hypothetical protein
MGNTCLPSICKMWCCLNKYCHPMLMLLCNWIIWIAWAYVIADDVVHFNLNISQCLWGASDKSDQLYGWPYAIADDHSSLNISQCLWCASSKFDHISMPLLLCLLCWPYLNTNYAENKFITFEWWHVTICRHLMIFLVLFQVTPSHMLLWQRLGLLW